MAQRNLVDPFRLTNPLTAVDAVLKRHVHGVVEVELRETQGDGVVKIGQCEVVGLNDGTVRDVYAIELAETVHIGTSYEEGRQHHGVGSRLAVLDIGGLEDGKAVVIAEIDHIIVGVHAHTVEVLLLIKTIAIDMADEL